MCHFVPSCSLRKCAVIYHFYDIFQHVSIDTTFWQSMNKFYHFYFRLPYHLKITLISVDIWMHTQFKNIDISNNMYMYWFVKWSKYMFVKLQYDGVISHCTHFFSLNKLNTRGSVIICFFLNIVSCLYKCSVKHRNNCSVLDIVFARNAKSRMF